jgi:uncharacterized RDD family membrane protein YckC
VKTQSPRAIAMQGLRAGFVSRVAAAGIDVLIVFLAFLVALAGWAVVVYLVTDEPLDLPDPGAVATGAAMLVLLIIVLTFAWSGSGRTIGNSVVGLRVVTQHGNDCSWRRALVRATVVVVLPVVSMLWILVSRKNAGLHDLVCRTTVIYDWRSHSGAAESRPHE